MAGEHTPDQVHVLLAEARECLRADRLRDAEVRCRQVLQSDPSNAHALWLLGSVLRKGGNAGFAVALLERAAKLAPLEAHIQHSLGLAYRALGRTALAENSLRRAAALAPLDAPVLVDLGVFYLEQSQWQRAEECFEAALEGDPEHLNAHLDLGATRLRRGQLAGAIAAFRRALEIDPGFADAQSNLLYALHFDPDTDSQALVALAEDWGRRHADPLGRCVPPHDNDPDPERRLRVGYVSGDFRTHPVAYFLEGVLSQHDRNEVEIFAYSATKIVDSTTRRLQNLTDRWRLIAGLKDADAADLIREDGIDVLVDLSGHTDGHRLLLFAQRPAPVQATWLGTFGTTGLAAMDYFLGDRYVTPESGTSVSEQVVRLPDSYQCFSPQVTAAVGPLPAATNGYVTFGCFNRAIKLSAKVIEPWSRILNEIPDARLCLKDPAFDEPAVAEQYLDLFRANGIADSRICMLGQTAHAEHVAAYSGIDIALDPFPFSGCTTSVEALWMGVPVITLPTDRFAGRTTASYLHTLRLPELIATNADDYVALAVALARDTHHLALLRGTLRQRLLDSPLCDAPRFARGLEAAFRQMWRHWCRSSVEGPGK